MSERSMRRRMERETDDEFVARAEREGFLSPPLLWQLKARLAHVPVLLSENRLTFLPSPTKPSA